jgi:hypothetical protein
MVMIAIGDYSFPAYADVAFADQVMAGDVLRAAPWATRNEEAKARGLVSAARIMRVLPWCNGLPSTTENIDPIVAEVNALLAADVLTRPSLVAPTPSVGGIKSAKAGSAEVEFFETGKVVATVLPIPQPLWDYLLAVGLLCPGTVLKPGEDTNAEPYVSGINAGCEFRPLGGRFECDPWTDFD